MDKNFLKSKTVWFNILTGVIVLATMFGYTQDNQVAQQYEGIFIALAPLVNIALRFITKTGVTVR